MVHGGHCQKKTGASDRAASDDEWSFVSQIQ